MKKFSPRSSELQVGFDCFASVKAVRGATQTAMHQRDLKRRRQQPAVAFDKHGSDAAFG